MAYGSTPYVGMVPKKNGSHIKIAQMTCWKCRCKASISTIRHYRVAMGPLSLLENIAEVPDQQVTKTGKSSIF